MAIVTADLPAPTTGDVLFEIGRGLRAAHDGDDPAAVYMLVAPLVQSFVVGVVEAAKREARQEAVDPRIAEIRILAEAAKASTPNAPYTGLSWQRVLNVLDEGSCPFLGCDKPNGHGHVWPPERAGVGAVPQTTEAPDLEPDPQPVDMDRINMLRQVRAGLELEADAPVGAPLVGEGPTQ